MIKELESIFSPAVIMLMGCGAWLIRLEAKVMYLEKDHELHKVLVKESELLMWKKIEELQKDTKQVLLSLARIEESLRNKRAQ